MSKRKVHKSKLSIIDFQKKFNLEDKCCEFLFGLRFPQGFVCLECGCTEYYHIKKHHSYQCKCCHHQISVTNVAVRLRSVTNAEIALQNGMVSSSKSQIRYVKS